MISDESDQLEQPAEQAQSVETQSAVSLGMTRSDQVFLSMVAMLCVLILAAGELRNRLRGNETIEISRLESAETLFQLNVNSATWVEWMQLDGIGEVTARKIVADRDENGPFLSIDDLQRVKGIGPKTVEKNRKHLVCDSCSDTQQLSSN